MVEDERPCPDRRRVESDVVQLAFLRQEMRRQHCLIVFGNERRVRLGKVDDRGSVIRRVQASDEPVWVTKGHVVVGVDVCTLREGNVTAGERSAVLPVYSTPQFVDDRATVGADPAVLPRRHDCGEDRLYRPVEFRAGK